MAYNTAYDLDALVVATKAATVYTAQESSLFLAGGLIPMVQLPAGSISAQIPVMGAVTASKLTSGSHNAEDFSALGTSSSKVTIEANIYAARDVIRDLGGIDPNELGRVLGNAVAASFDTDVAAALDSLSAATATGDVTVNLLFDVAAEIRAGGETGQLMAVLSPAQAANLMKAVGSSAFAGGAFQTEAMVNGWIGSVAGIRCYQSAYVTANNGAVFSMDALRIAMFQNVNLEVQRRAAAVGNDVVASLHAGVGVIDSARGYKIAA
jgi:hypothetical protein